MKQLAAALGAALGELALELLEPAARSTAVEAERAPVAEYSPPLLAQPVRSLPHATTVTPRGR